MSWRDPKSPWAIAMRRRRRTAYWAVVILPFAILAGGGALYVPTRGSTAAENRTFDIVVWALIFVAIALAAWWTFRAARRERAISNLVPQRDGRVCHECLAALSPELDAGRCPTCHMRYTHRELRAKWERYALENVFYYQRSERGGRAYWWSNPLMGLVTLLPLVVALFSAGPAGARGLPGGLAAVGGFVVLWAVSNWLTYTSYLRFGDTLHCGTCGYQFAEVANPERCPECGRPWLEPGELMRGAPGGQPWMRSWGRALLIGAVVWMLATLGLTLWSKPPMPILPTAVLIRIAGASPLTKPDAWKELTRRDLTDSEIRSLAELALATQARTSGFSFDVYDWIGAQIVAGRMPPDLIERFALWYSAPTLTVSPSAAGAPYAAALSFGSIFSARHRPVYIVFLVDSFTSDNPSQVVRHRGDGVCLDTLPDKLPRARVEFGPAAPGPIQVCARFWLVIDRNAGPIAVSEWSDDGTPKLPPSVLWHKAFEITADAECRTAAP